MSDAFWMAKLACITTLVLGGCDATPSAGATAPGGGANDVNLPVVDARPGPQDAAPQVAIDSGRMPDAERIGPSGPSRCKHAEVVEDCLKGWCHIPAGCLSALKTFPP